MKKLWIVATSVLAVLAAALMFGQQQMQTVSLEVEIGPKLDLAWDVDAKDTSAVGWNLYRGTSPGAEDAAPLNAIPITDCSIYTPLFNADGTPNFDPNDPTAGQVCKYKFTDLHVLAGQTYYYVSRAVFADGTLGAASNEISYFVDPGECGFVRGTWFSFCGG